MTVSQVKIKVKNKRERINTPFGYFGSKNKIAIQLCSQLPPHNCWVEAFAGSAALTVRKTPAPIEIINDIDKEVVNVFEQMRSNYNALCRALELTPYAEQELIDSRIEILNPTNLERARRFLVQSMMAINGVFGDERGGFSYSDSYSRNDCEARVNRWNNLPKRIDSVIKRLKNVRIENKDALKLLTRFINRPATLIYMDPPYLGDRSSGYSMDANDASFHKKLLQLANKAKAMIFISGYSNDLYNKMLSPKKGWEKKTINTSTKDSSGGVHKRVEVVWMNKHFLKAQKEKEIQIQLTMKEAKHNKLNPERLRKPKNTSK